MPTQKTGLLPAVHPVAPEMRLQIESALARIEAEHEVRILFACESGSRGWGFASPDSDYDVRFVYVHKLPWYLRVEPQRDVIELPIHDLLDVNGWELRKSLQLLRRSNPVLLEWLDSPIQYRTSAGAEQLRCLASAFFSPLKGRHHYLAMARRNAREHLQGEFIRQKKYFYVLRPLLAVRWIDAGLGRPPMRFVDLAHAVLDDAALLAEIGALLAAKMAANEAEYGPRWPRIQAFIEQSLACAGHDDRYREPQGETRMLDDFLQAQITASAPVSAGVCRRDGLECDRNEA